MSKPKHVQFPEVVVGANAVVSGSLDVERGQVQGDLKRLLKEGFGELLCHHTLRLQHFRRDPEQTTQQRVQPACKQDGDLQI